MSARLMAVADVYDALISKRVYKPAFTHETAMEMIRQGSGEHFDPDVVDAMLTVEEEFMAIAERYRDEADTPPCARSAEYASPHAYRAAIWLIVGVCLTWTLLDRAEGSSVTRSAPASSATPKRWRAIRRTGCRSTSTRCTA
jgi:hypothetical protein